MSNFSTPELETKARDLAMEIALDMGGEENGFRSTGWVVQYHGGSTWKNVAEVVEPGARTWRGGTGKLVVKVRKVSSTFNRIENAKHAISPLKDGTYNMDLIAHRIQQLVDAFDAVDSIKRSKDRALEMAFDAVKSSPHYGVFLGVLDSPFFIRPSCTPTSDEEYGPTIEIRATLTIDEFTRLMDAVAEKNVFERFSGGD